MGLFSERRVSRKVIGRYRAPATRAAPPLEQLIEESRMVAHSAVRMAVKNKLIMDAAGDRRDFDRAGLRAVAREALEQLAQQQRAAAEYEAANGGDPRRGPVLRGLADALEADAEDRELLAQIAEGAREAAWAELAASLSTRLGQQAERPVIDADYLVGREDRMAALIAIDLPQLRWLMKDRFEDK